MEYRSVKNKNQISILQQFFINELTKIDIASMRPVEPGAGQKFL